MPSGLLCLPPSQLWSHWTRAWHVNLWQLMYLTSNSSYLFTEDHIDRSNQKQRVPRCQVVSVGLRHNNGHTKHQGVAGPILDSKLENTGPAQPFSLIHYMRERLSIPNQFGLVQPHTVMRTLILALAASYSAAACVTRRSCTRYLLKNTVLIR